MFLILFIIFIAIIIIITPLLSMSKQIKEIRDKYTLLEIKTKSLSATLEEIVNKSEPNSAKSDQIYPFQQYKGEKIEPSITPEAVNTPNSDTLPKVEASYSEQVNSNYKTPPIKKERISFEQQFGAQLPVWIGGIALALAGFFMVKYSIEIGLLSPMVRVILGILFGFGMLHTANVITTKPDFANGDRIAQALSGAGISVLYVCIFAATSLYHLIPAFIGFVGMAATTALAVLLSLRRGMPVALLGLVGGFLTPAIINSGNPQAPLLFIYLYFILAGLMVVIRKQGWWVLSIPTVIAAFAWVCIWLGSGNFTSSDTVYLGLFLIAVSATTVMNSRRYYEQDNAGISDNISFSKTSTKLNYFTLGGATVIFGIVSANAGFGLMEWLLFGLISIGGIALSFFNQKLYGLAPWVSMLVNIIMLSTWYTNNTNHAIVNGLFAALFIGSGYILQLRSPKPLMWAGLVAATSILYYLVSYYLLRATDIPLFWGLFAFALSWASIYALQNVMFKTPDTHPQKQHLMAVYAAISSAFLSIALTIELSHEFLSVSFALQLLAITWINTKVNVKALRYIAGIIACVFGILLIPQIFFLNSLVMHSLFETHISSQNIPIVKWPVFQLGLPALCFVIGSHFLRIQKDNKLVQILESSAITLIVLMGYFVTRHIFQTNGNAVFLEASFTERGIITNIIFIYGLACIWVGKKFLRQSALIGGFILSGIAIFRIFYFDFLIHNPLLDHTQEVGYLPLINSLIFTYGTPIIWTWQLLNNLPHIGKPKWEKYGYGIILLLSFTFITLNVRQLFQGTHLDGNDTSNAEIYAYSIVWLLSGVALLFFGTIRKDSMIRIASLVVMILTVGKVFLYDTSALDGLLRVFSFLGLGLSLLGLSWFYTRFVFIKDASKKQADK